MSFQKKLITFLSAKCCLFFLCSIILFFLSLNIFFCTTSTFLLTWNNFSCNINLFQTIPDYFSCNIELFVLTQNCFSRKIKFLFWALFRMLCHGDIFLMPHSNQKYNDMSKKKIMWNKNINFVFCASQISYIQFLRCTLAACLSHWQHVGSGPRNKETFNPSFAHLPNIG